MYKSSWENVKLSTGVTFYVLFYLLRFLISYNLLLHDARRSALILQHV